MGRLTTHVLDNVAGGPARGVRIDLYALAAGVPPRHIKTIATNDDGRADEPLLAGEAFVPGTYELRFHVADYFAAMKTQQASAPFLDIVPIRFTIAERDSHYHVPLLVTPWSYSTYRGS